MLCSVEEGTPYRIIRQSFDLQCPVPFPSFPPDEWIRKIGLQVQGFTAPRRRCWHSTRSLETSLADERCTHQLPSRDPGSQLIVLGQSARLIAPSYLTPDELIVLNACIRST